MNVTCFEVTLEIADKSKWVDDMWLIISLDCALWQNFIVSVVNIF